MTTEVDMIEVPRTPEERGALALTRIMGKSDFKVHLVVYLAVNAMLVAIWAFTTAGRPFPGGFFWPIFVIAGWGIGVLVNGYVAYRGNVVSEEQIQREMSHPPR